MCEFCDKSCATEIIANHWVTLRVLHAQCCHFVSSSSLDNTQVSWSAKMDVIVDLFSILRILDGFADHILATGHSEP